MSVSLSLSLSDKTKFENKIKNGCKPDPSTGCWNWIRWLCKGRAMMSLHRTPVVAARVAYAVFKGDPGALHVCHSCDNMKCVNPDHLWLGTNQDNVDDKMQKGRMKPNKGSKHPMAVLTEEQVLSVRLRLSSGERGSDLSREFGVSRATISLIKLGRIWKEV